MAIKNLHKMTLKEITNGIDTRIKLLQSMVGTLYGQVVIAELDELEERRCVIEQILENEGIK